MMTMSGMKAVVESIAVNSQGCVKKVSNNN
jgi:hypothetical protein